MIVFALTVFLSAFLLFLVQPMIARMILPWFGGTAAVWSTCLLFFQCVLLAGYVYTHGIVMRLSAKKQVLVHSAVLGMSLLLLPVAPNPAWKPSDPNSPILHILVLLGITIGLPYFALSTTGPLLQAWYARTHRDRAPYWLFALSNLGSLLALICYPALIEPLMRLKSQSILWSAGFACFATLCFLAGRRSVLAGKGTEGVQNAVDPMKEEPAPSARTLCSWAVLAAAPSILLLAMTSHMSLYIAPIPFLWVLPLALYLISFILCFDTRGWYLRKTYLSATPVALCTIAWLQLRSDRDLVSILGLILLYAAAFFVICMVCHGELSLRKPAAQHLTHFYLMLATGGAAGGIFVALAAPAFFNASYELPLAIVLCSLIWVGVLHSEPEWVFRRDPLGAPFLAVATIVIFVLCAGGISIHREMASGLTVNRNFYGTQRVIQYGAQGDWNTVRFLKHGLINHGGEFTHPTRRSEIATYYHSGTGIGVLMAHRDPGRRQKVGIVGLGTGVMCAFSRRGDEYRIYEINPLVEKIARTSFWFLSSAQGDIRIILGDARLSLERESPNGFDVLAVDAFSSDTIPTHLLTLEAMRLYFQHLQPDGVLAFHISNRYLELRPVLRSSGRALGKIVVFKRSVMDEKASRFATDWALMGSETSVLRQPAFREMQGTPAGETQAAIWTDDYSNLLGVLK